MSPTPGSEIRLRVVVVQPPRDIEFCVQGKLGEFLGSVRSPGDDLVFDVSIRATVSAEGVRLLGNVVQGPPSGRFLYVCSGTSAGDAKSCWTRRAKVPVCGISAALAKKALAGGRLEVHIAGKARDGGPACATVPLLGKGWVFVG